MRARKMRARTRDCRPAGLSLTALLCAMGPALAGPHVGRPSVQRPHAAPRIPTVRAPSFPTPKITWTAPRVQSDPNAEGLLRQMLVAENTLALAGTQVTIVSGGAMSEQRILRNGARALRLDYLRPPQLASEQIVDDGKVYYHFLPRQNKTETQPSQVNTLRVRVPQVISQIRRGELLVQWVGQDSIAGHACGIVDVTTRAAAPAARRRFWIDPTNGAQLKIEQYNASGQLLSVSYYTSVTYNPPLNGHSFDPPHLGRIVTPQSPNAQPTVPTFAQVGFNVMQPGSLPPGFHFQSAAVSDFRGRKLVALRYVNGLNVVSVFETQDNGRGPASRSPRPDVLVARRGGLKLVLVSSLGKDVLTSVLNSLR